MSAQRFPISQAKWFKPLGAVLGGGHGAVEVTADDVQVRFGAMFRADVPRSAVRSARPATGPVLGWGAHGWRGRWLVNGSSSGRVTIEIDPVQRAWVTGVPVKLRELTVSVDDPDSFLAALAGSGSAG